jgi:hypothetical protein
MCVYFLKHGCIAAVKVLSGDTDHARIIEAKALFNAEDNDSGAQGFEVWDLIRFVYRYSPNIE